MNTEWFDVVDAQDRIIGRETRQTVHRDALRHRAVHLLLVRPGGDVLLQKRSMHKDCFPGTWDSSVSGHVDSGESYDACVMREAREELGIELATLPERRFKIDACADTGFEFVWIYLAPHAGPFRPDPAEIDALGWFSPDHIDRWTAEEPEAFAAAFRLLWGLHRNEPPTGGTP